MKKYFVMMTLILALTSCGETPAVTSTTMTTTDTGTTVETTSTIPVNTPTTIDTAVPATTTTTTTAPGTTPQPTTTAPTKTTSVTATTPATTTTITKTTTATDTGSYTLAEIAKHSGAGDCYTTINGSVYNLTSFLSKHPGGEANILKICGKDGTSLFENQHSGQPKPEAMLAKFYIGKLK